MGSPPFPYVPSSGSEDIRARMISPYSRSGDFWNRSIREVLEWLPLETCEAGINSGNVGL